ncbi:hypothetical protein DFH06DRAFT_1213212 [Mycena polygramma]|nr:hypothetical protein DFH06DRAFT_1213212 [Mycena polygramma]
MPREPAQDSQLGAGQAPRSGMPPTSTDRYAFDSTAPALPTELERRIFEIAAMTRPLSIPTYMLVAARVRIWLQPLLYRTIVVRAMNIQNNTPDGHPIFYEATFLEIMVSKPTAFKETLRHLFILSGRIQDAERILSLCGSVDNLWISCDSYTHEPRVSVSLIAQLPLKRLYCNLPDLFARQIDLTHSVFSRITHLELFNLVRIKDPQILYDLALVPHLTHLSMKNTMLMLSWLTLLRTCRSLRVLALINTRLDQLQEHELAKDPRFVVMDMPDLIMDWVMGANFGVDYWSQAEEFVAKRRSGEVDRVFLSYFPASVLIHLFVRFPFKLCNIK